MSKHIEKYLGELVISFAQLETALCEGLSQVLGISYADARIIFAAISFKKKTQILNALLRKYDMGWHNDGHIYKLLSKGNELEDQRNMFMHSDWEMFRQPISPNGEISYVLKRSKVKYGKREQAKVIVEKIGPTEIEKLRVLIHDFDNCAHDIFEEFGQIGSLRE